MANSKARPAWRRAGDDRESRRHPRVVEVRSLTFDVGQADRLGGTDGHAWTCRKSGTDGLDFECVHATSGAFGADRVGEHGRVNPQRVGHGFDHGQAYQLAFA